MTNSTAGLGEAIKWLANDFLSSRRRWQAAGVILLMLLGGLAELFTLAAVFPLLAVMTDPSSLAQSRVGELLAQAGIDLSQLSLFAVAGVFCVAALAAAVIRVTLAWASQKFVFHVANDVGVSLYERMLYQPYSFHAETNSSRIIAEIANVQRLVSGMFLPMIQAVSAIILGTFITVGLILIDPELALAALAGFSAIYFLISISMRGRLRRNSKTLHTTQKKRIQMVREGLGAIRDVLIDSSQPVYVRKFARLDKKLRNAQAANALIAVAPRFVVEALGMIFIVGLAIALMMIHGSLIGSLPVLAVLALGAQRLMPLLQQVYKGWSMYSANTALLLGVVDLLQRPLPPRFHMKAAPLSFEESLRVENVSFRYSKGEPPVLQDISVEIQKGSMVGFVGKSGSGKSTLVDLIMGLLQPTSGVIEVDRVPLGEDNIIAWQSQIAHVSQHIFLVDGSIIENVAFGVPSDQIELDRVHAACRQAEIGQFVESLPNGYETFVGEQGIRLSGGQRQRIGIARALYKRASLLILDEATSALDDETEAAIVSTLQRLGGEYTILMIAHRITTLRGCDVIYRLGEGHIVERGSYAEVIGDDSLGPIAASA